MRGRTTITVLGLNRGALLENRLRWAKRLKALRDARLALAISAGPSPSAEAIDALAQLDRLLAEAVLSGAEYAAMARAILGTSTP